VTFTFNGKEYTAHPGDTIASALAAAGVEVFSRSFKYHRPRGLLCAAGHCPNCLVQVGDEPSVRACKCAVQEGMKVEPQNVFPSLDRDVMSVIGLGSKFLPVGFYYKTFIHPKALWPLYEATLRRSAGLGKVTREIPEAHFSKQYLFADVAVVGGGPAGMSAAIAAAEQGARVLLFDDNPALGGHLNFAAQDEGALTPLVEKLNAHASIEVFTNTTVLGWYEDNWLSAVRDGGGRGDAATEGDVAMQRLYKIRAGALVAATGAYEVPLVFDNNDLPGVMLGSAVQRMVRLYGVLPGQNAVVVTANEDGWRVARALREAGANVVAIADEREEWEVATQGDAARQGDVAGQGDVATQRLYGWTIRAAVGNGRVNGAALVRNDGTDVKEFECDLIVMSVGWMAANELVYEAGARANYDEARGEILPVELPEAVFVAGRAAGAHDLAHQVKQGALAGKNAAAKRGFGDAISEGEWGAVEKGIASEPRRSSTRAVVPGTKKRFLCICEDVTDHDVETAIQEGFDTMELLKRYSTVTMGPCGGKMCAMNAIRLCGQTNQWTVQKTGTTTARPPTKPVSLGALAGQHMEPVQVTPVHEWHKERGAKMMLAGLWLRPEHYGDATAEVKAVRERVGLIDVSTLGKLRLHGAGVPALLERIYVNEWKGLGIGRVRYGVMCNDEGVVLDDGVCAHLGEDEWYMTTTTSGASAIFEWIQSWTQSGWGDGVHVVNVSEVFAAFNLAGPRARDVLAKLTTLDVSNTAFPYMNVREAEVAEVACRLMRIGFTGELSYEIHVPSGYARHVWNALIEAGAEFGISPFGVEAQRVLRLEKAHIIVSQDTDAVTDPFSADLGWMVKLTKPDFLGKRSLARIAKEGPKQRLVGFKMTRPTVVPKEGLQVVRRTKNRKQESIGHITSSRFSPTLKETIGLCWLPAEMAQENTPFTIRMNGTLEEARVHHGAFYDAKGERLRM
jgi:sarcosine oxidase subunit alpha